MAKVTKTENKKNKHPGGRPSSYGPDIIEKTKDYLQNYGEYGDAIPSIAGLACVLHIARDTIYDWAKQEEKKEFSDILQDILSSQEKILLNNGLNKKFDSSITKLVLGKHGYKEKTDVTSDDKPIGQSTKDLDDETLRHIATGGK